MKGPSGTAQQQDEAITKVRNQFYDVLATKSSREEMMIVLILTTNAIVWAVNDLFNPIECAKAANLDLVRQIRPSESTMTTRTASPPPPPGPQSTASGTLIDYGQPLSKSDDRAKRAKELLTNPEIEPVSTAVTDAVEKWRYAVLRQFGRLLEVPSTAVDVRMREPRSETVGWTNPTVPVGVPGRINNQLVSDLTVDQRKQLVIIVLAVFVILLVNYDGFGRRMMLIVTASLDLDPADLSIAEQQLAAELQAADVAGNPAETDKITKSRQDRSAAGRKLKIGAATVAGAALIGLTGGLAAPFLVMSVATVMGGIGLGGVAAGLGAVGLANPLVIAGIFGAIGGRMSRRAVDEITKEVKDFKFIRLPLPSASDERATSDSSRKDRLKNDDDGNSSTLIDGGDDRPHRLRVVIGISGWVAKQSDVTGPWSAFDGAASDVFALRYEFKELNEMSSTLDKMLRNSAYSIAQASALRMVVPAIMTAGLVPFSLLHMGGLIDNPFRVAMTRSDKAGLVLATTLAEQRSLGHRPVTLVGFSVGARVVYSCLLELARRRKFGLIENAILIGAPIPADSDAWLKIRSVVTGRLINVFNKNDLILAYFYRTMHAQVKIAGIGPVDLVPSVENVDATHLVHGHKQYLFAVGPILSHLGLGVDLDEADVKRQSDALAQEDRFEKNEHEKAVKKGELKEFEDNLLVGSPSPTDSVSSMSGTTISGSQSQSSRLPPRRKPTADKSRAGIKSPTGEQYADFDHQSPRRNRIEMEDTECGDK